MQRFNFDARTVDPKTKKAALLGDSVPDDEKRKLGIPEEEKPDIVLPEGEKPLTPVRPLPGAPKGQRGEVEEDYAPMTAAEIAQKRLEQEKPEDSEEALVDAPVPPSFRDIMKNLLKSESPEGKKEQAMQEKYGPPEAIKGMVDNLEPFQRGINNVDIATVQSMIERADLPDILKERAQSLLDSRSRNDLIKSEQLALNLMGANTRKEAQKATDWLNDTSEGQEYRNKAFDLYRTRKVMSMLSNTILSMEGQSVIDQPKGDPRSSKEQQTEKKRLNELAALLDSGKLTNAEFEDAKRKGMSATEAVSARANPPVEGIQGRVEREYRDEERAKREKGGFRLNMSKHSNSYDEWDVTTYLVRGGELDHEYIINKITEDAITTLEDPQDEWLGGTQLGDSDFFSNLQEYIGVRLNTLYDSLIEYGYSVDELATLFTMPGDSPPAPRRPEEYRLLDDDVLPKGDRFYKYISDSVMSQLVSMEDLRGIQLNKPPEDSNLPGNMPPDIANKLNMRKEAVDDVSGPGGDKWDYEWTSGDSPTKQQPEKRKHRYPFHNRPSGRTPGDGEQGNLFEVGPMGGESDMNYLSSIIKSMEKTADNDMFSTFSFDNDSQWMTYTLFKKAYSKFRAGDVVIQHGKTAADCATYRRRFGSVKRAKKLLVGALEPILANTVSSPTPDDTLHDLQKGAPPGGNYGPHTSPYDQQPWQGNRDGFDAKNTPRNRTKRKVMPFMDQADDEGSGFTPGRTMGTTDKLPPRRTETCPNKDEEDNLPLRQHRHWKGEEDNLPLRQHRHWPERKRDIPSDISQKSTIGSVKAFRRVLANAVLTPAGQAKLFELSAQVDVVATDLYTVLDAIAQNEYTTAEEVYLNRAGAVEDQWHYALQQALVQSDDLTGAEVDESFGDLPGNIPPGMAQNSVRKILAAMPAIETPEERAGTIEQPPVKPINQDPKRPLMPKKRYDRPEQNLTNSPDYSGEDSSGWARERITLSMKKRKCDE